MLPPIVIALRTKKGDIREIASMLQNYAVDSNLAEEVFQQFKANLKQQLAANRHTVGYKAGTYYDAHGYKVKVDHDYRPGAYLGTLRYTLNPGSDGRLIMRIEMGGMDVERPNATGRFVKYARLIDQAFGPYHRRISTNQAFFGARKGAGGQFARFKPGKVFKMHQPVNSKIAWMDAMASLKPKVTRDFKEYFATAKTGRKFYNARDAKGRFTKVRL